jgi:hypothetical protein
MSFFYDLNKKLDSIRATPEVTHQQLNERDMSRAAKGYEKYGKQGMEALAKAGREGKALNPVRKKFDKYDEGRDFGPGRAGPNKNQAGPTSGNALYGPSPDSANYKTPNLDKRRETTDPIDKEMDDPFYSFKKYPGDFTNAFDKDGQGQTKYVNRTAPGVINKIKDKLGYDMPDPAYGPRPDETQRLAKRYPAPAKSVDEGGEVINGVYKLAIEPKRPEEEENKMTRGTRPKSNKSNQLFPPMRLPSDEKFPPMRLPKGDERVFPPMRLPTDENLIPVPAKPKSTVDKQIDKAKTPPPYRPSKSAPKGEFMGTIKGGVWTADPPKRGEKGVPVPMDPEGVPESGAPMTAKRKFTFADKIANAKKEVDEMLGDVAAEAMRTALSPKQKKIDMNKNGKLDANDFAMLRQGRKPEMDEERSKGTAFDLSTPRATKPKVGSIERGAKHDIKHTATGRMVTRRTDDQGNSVGADDDSDTQAGPRGHGFGIL